MAPRLRSSGGDFDRGGTTAGAFLLNTSGRLAMPPGLRTRNDPTEKAKYTPLLNNLTMITYSPNVWLTAQAAVVLFAATTIGASAGAPQAKTVHDQTVPTQKTEPKKEANKGELPKLARDLIGTWVLIGEPGRIGAPPENGGLFKSFDGERFLLHENDPITGERLRYIGYYYTIDGNEMTTTIVKDQGVGSTRLFRTTRFRISLKDNRFTQIGLDNPWNEVWQRVSTQIPPREEFQFATETPTWLVAMRAYSNDGKVKNAIQVLRNTTEYLRAQNLPNGAFLQATLEFSLGEFLMGIANWSEASDAYAKARESYAKLEGPDSANSLIAATRFATMLMRQERFPEATTHLRELLKRAETRFGANNRFLVNILNGLALALQGMNAPEDAERCLNRILELKKTGIGHSPMDYGTIDNNRGICYLQTGDPTSAMSFFEKALAADKARGSAPDNLVVRNALRATLDKNDREAATTIAMSLFKIETNNIKTIFPGLSEGQRLASISNIEPIRWFATLGIPELIAQAIIETKAITLDQLLTFRPFHETPDTFSDLLKPELAHLGMRPFPVSQSKIIEATIAKVSAETRDAARKRYQNPIFSLQPNEVCRALPKDTVVIEFVRYNHYIGRRKDERRYGALVFLPKRESDTGAATPLVWIPLGPADTIDREINSLATEIHDPVAAGIVSSRLRTLFDLVWGPVALALPGGSDNVFICPDGPLCFLPFGALLDQEKRFLGDKHLIMYLSTVRDLFRTEKEVDADNKGLSVFAAPNYEPGSPRQDAAQLRFRDTDVRALGGLKLVNLPGARSEAESIQALAQQKGFTPVVYYGDSANKENVRALRRPHMVHFATHGFFLPADPNAPPGNPMDRSGLALAGAQVTLKALSEGRSPPIADDDGLLTARDVAQLPLAGTWLATISACESGRGEARDGEGVLGLRRGFLAAGVQNLVFAIWRIPDQETAAFMRDFYERALESSDPATALALTQREWLGRLRKDRGIAAAVTTAGAFVLNTSGRFPLPTAKPETSGANDAGAPLKLRTK